MIGEGVQQRQSPGGEYMNNQNLPDITEMGEREIFADQLNFELDQPFTVDWLVEIGFRHAGHGVYVNRDFQVYQTSCNGWRCVAFGAAYTKSKPITTRRDVLKWLDVLDADCTDNTDVRKTD